ncbi:MAG: fatty acid desaturase family protein [Deltaproteobacteria bacterium]|nr:fatty acid desaturase family protein [Deltaproteobacteria bacterium]
MSSPALAPSAARETTDVGKAAAAMLKDVLSIDERKALLRINPLRSIWMVASNWLAIFAVMALVAWAPNPLTILLALWIIGARQLGMAIVMHEAAHRTLFRNRRLNDWVGNWLAAYPVWADVGPYRAYHLMHHSRTGTDQDPDLGLAAPFPITAASFRRKVWRDLSGQTGWKQAKAVFRRDVGWSRGRNQRSLGMNEGEQPDVGFHKLVPVGLTNALLLAGLTLAGYPALYLLWAVAWLTTYRLVTRIRSIAEHGMVPDRLDPLRNTRTVLASWWERLLLAPNRVNFHLEHHLLMTVPHHNLPALHRLLRARAAIDERCLAPGYVALLKLATSRA